MNALASSPSRMRLAGFAIFLLILSAACVSASIIPASSLADGWQAVNYGSLVPDWYSDQQTGDRDSDFVGTNNAPAAFFRYDDNGTPGDTSDDQLGFRTRMAEDTPPPGFDKAVFVGLDGNSDGALDIFIGVNNSGAAKDSKIAIWDAGTGANISPNTTSLANPPPAAYTYTLTALNYNYGPVTAALDPYTPSFDLDGLGNTDQFITFVVPFPAVSAAMMSLAGIAGFSPSSQVSYVIASSRQSNALNEDLNGVNGGVNSQSTWAALGALSVPGRVDGVAVPEPFTGLFVLFGGTLFALWKLPRRE